MTWCEFYGYEQNSNLEMCFNLRAKEYIKAYVKENKKKFGKGYTQEDLVINEKLEQIKKELFGG